MSRHAPRLIITFQARKEKDQISGARDGGACVGKTVNQLDNKQLWVYAGMSRNPKP